MSVSDEERETLHIILDAILNARNSLEGIDHSKLKSDTQYYHSVTRPRNELCKQASIFIRRVIGPSLHQDELVALFETELEENSSDIELMATLANLLRSFLPLFMVDARDSFDGRDEVIVQVIEDLLGIQMGDDPRFFSIAKRRQGQHRRPYRLNRLRLTALRWDKYLKSNGMGARDRHRILSDAYKTDWDAIRKWARPIVDQYGSGFSTPADSEWQNYQFSRGPDKVMDSIKHDGEAYWLEKCAAESGK